MSKLRRFQSRDDFFMGMACMATAGAKSSTANGAVVTNANNTSWAVAHDEPPSPAIENGEQNVPAEIIAMNRLEYTQGGTMFSMMCPSKESLAQIAHRGVKRVVYLKGQEKEATELARLCYVSLEKYKGNINWMRDYMMVCEKKGVFS